jgi:hypothetical protein
MCLAPMGLNNNNRRCNRGERQTASKASPKEANKNPDAVYTHSFAPFGDRIDTCHFFRRLHRRLLSYARFTDCSM